MKTLEIDGNFARSRLESIKIMFKPRHVLLTLCLIERKPSALLHAVQFLHKNIQFLL